MKSDRWWWGLLLVGCLGAGCASSPDAGVPFGTFEVTSFHSAPISALGDEEATQWIGQRMVLEPERARFRGAVIEAPLYAASTQSRADFIQQNLMPPQTLGITGELVHRLRIAGEVGAGHEVVVTSPDRLLTLWDGVWFVLERRE